MRIKININLTNLVRKNRIYTCIHKVINYIFVTGKTVLKPILWAFHFLFFILAMLLLLGFFLFTEWMKDKISLKTTKKILLCSLEKKLEIDTCKLRKYFWVKEILLGQSIDFVRKGQRLKSYLQDLACQRLKGKEIWERSDHTHL